MFKGIGVSFPSSGQYYLIYLLTKGQTVRCSLMFLGCSYWKWFPSSVVPLDSRPACPCLKLICSQEYMSVNFQTMYKWLGFCVPTWKRVVSRCCQLRSHSVCFPIGATSQIFSQYKLYSQSQSGKYMPAVTREARITSSCFATSSSTVAQSPQCFVQKSD
jgi:hypothetical protein